MKQILEIHNDYTDDNNLVHIDCWFENSEEGETVAVVDLDTKKVIFFDNRYRMDKLVLESINEVLNEIETPINSSEKLIRSIDFKQLREQKELLYSNQKFFGIDTVVAKELEGLINLLDSIQDHAVDVLGINETEVFGERKED